MEIFAGILAGGVGLRMGADRPKQLLELDGKPILLHTIERFLPVERIRLIFVAAPEGYIDEITRLCAVLPGAAQRVRVIKGGRDRNDSLMNVIGAVRAANGGEDALLVSHDAARPFVTPQIIESGIDAALKAGASNTVIPSVDTPVRSEDGITVSAVPDRAGLYNTQTPQTFHTEGFARAYGSLDNAERLRMTDACRVLLSAGETIALVPGDPRNIKLTSPFDMLVAEAIVEEEKRRR